MRLALFLLNRLMAFNNIWQHGMSEHNRVSPVYPDSYAQGHGHNGFIIYFPIKAARKGIHYTNDAHVVNLNNIPVIFKISIGQILKCDRFDFIAILDGIPEPVVFEILCSVSRPSRWGTGSTKNRQCMVPGSE